MLQQLDRFSVGLDDPQNAPVYDYCAECGCEIYVGETVWQMGNDLLCSKDCLIGFMQVERITVGE